MQMLTADVNQNSARNRLITPFLIIHRCSYLHFVGYNGTYRIITDSGKKSENVKKKTSYLMSNLYNYQVRWGLLDSRDVLTKGMDTALLAVGGVLVILLVLFVIWFIFMGGIQTLPTWPRKRYYLRVKYHFSPWSFLKSSSKTLLFRHSGGGGPCNATERNILVQNIENCTEKPDTFSNQIQVI